MLKDVFTKPFDLMKVNPYVRFVMLYNINSDEHHVPRRMLYDYALICVIQGEIWFRYGGEQVCVKAGEIHLMPPMVTHREVIKKGERCKYYVVHFDMIYDPARADIDMESVYLSRCVPGVAEVEPDRRLLASDREEVGLMKGPFKTRPREFDRLLECLKRMESLVARNRYRTAQHSDTLSLKGDMLEILAYLWEDDADKNDDYYQCVDSFIQYVRYHFAEDVDIASLAAKYGFTPNYFRSVFKKITGITPFEYLQRFRLSRAQELLQEHRFSVQQVAFLVGFNDPFYFSKAFKKRTGATPKKYAKNPKIDGGGVKFPPVNRAIRRAKTEFFPVKARVFQRAFYIARKVV